MLEIDKLDGASHDVAADKRSALLHLFPEAALDGGLIDFELLQRTLGATVETGRERYGLSWPGKAECFKTIQAASMATLLPVPDESVRFDATQNSIIEGDNLEVLKLLQKSYLNKIKMIYIDPPYNTGNDFIYPDDYSETLQTYLQYTGQVDSEGRKFGTNSDTEGRFHSKWLNMMYPRLYLARNLLTENGCIFISIDDHEVASLRLLCNEIFGEENFITQFVWNTEGHTDNQFHVKVNHEYVLFYAKDSSKVDIGHVIDPNTRKESNLWQGFAENSITKNGEANPPSVVALPIGFPCKTTHLNLPSNNPPEDFYEQVGRLGYISRDLTSRFDVSYPIRRDIMVVEDNALIAPCSVFSGWANVDKLRSFIAAGCEAIDDAGDALSFYLSSNGVIYYRRERDKARNIVSVLRGMGTTERMRSELEGIGVPFQYPKPKELLRYLLEIGLSEDGIVLDFFGGSGTVAQAVLELNKHDGRNRQFILVQLPEPTGRQDFGTIANLMEERVRRNIANEYGAPETQLALDAMPASAPGFRLFRLAESNVKEWNASLPRDAAVLAEQLSLSVDHIRHDRTDSDVLFEVALKSGYQLSVTVDTERIGDSTIYSVSNGAFIICLERHLTLDLIRTIIARGPERALFLDEGFAANDQLKANAVQAFKARAIVLRTL
jgi:adenine-specific DNA-methyltransferase